MSVAERLEAIDTAALSDALDRLNVGGQVLGIMPLDRSFSVVGKAFTVRMLPRGLSGKSVGDYIDDVPAGSVVVIDNQGRLDATVWGDILTSVAQRRGVAGTVIDGVCRDVGRALELDYAVYCRGTTMRTGKDRVSAEAYNEALQISGVRVEPNDWIRGDGDGVVVVPASIADRVLDAAEEIAAVEDRIRGGITAGRRLHQLRTSVGYHDLQSAESP